MREQVVTGDDFVPIKQKLQLQIEKMQIGNGSSKQRNHNQLIQQQRRKWGDWSECSKDCLRTRHRRNCDDLVQVQNSTASGGLISSKSNSISVTTEAAGGGNSKRQVSVEQLSDGTANGDEEDLLLRAGDSANNEDEDYADVGDEEDEIDSCERVDASKTTEQIPCTGGLCPLSPNHQLAEQAPFVPASGKGQNQKLSRDRVAAGRHQRPTKLNGFEQQGNSLLVRDENEYSITRHRLRDNPAASSKQLSDKQHRQYNKQAQLSRFHSHQASGQQFQDRNGSANSSVVGLTIINSNGTQAYKEEETGGGGGGGEPTLADTSLATSNLNNGATTATTGSAATNAPPDSAINSVWTRSMWPQHLLNGVSTNQQPDFSQPATLIQWTILIGSLLSVVLLILLILRKLFVSTFPSYQWMLAKQTLKNTSKLKQTGAASLDCCQAASAIHHQTAARHLSAPGTIVGSAAPCVAVGPASRTSPGGLLAALKPSSSSSAPNKHHHHIHYQQASSIPPHHMCYAWRRQQQQPPHSLDIEGVACRNGQQNQRLSNVATAHQYIVDSKGNHILNSSLGANFNTDIYDLPASFARESANSMTNSTSTSAYNVPRTTISNQNNNNNLEYESQSEISANYNYDTLNSNYGNQAINVVQHDQQQRQSHMSALEKGFHLPHNYLPQPKSSSFNPIKGQQNVQDKSEQVEFSEHELHPLIVGLNHYQHQQAATSSNEAKHRSPKVPNSQKRFDQTKAGAGLVDTKTSSSLSTISGASGRSDGNESTSSPSIQSTTAQMLSNAASCSFEQTPDQNNDFLPSCTNENNNDNNDSPLSSIPTSSTGLNNLNLQHRIRNGISNTSKLACSNTVQSQPNSPMFANQFVNTNRSGSGRLKQRTCHHSHAIKLMSSTSRLNQSDCKESDCSQLDLVDQQQQEEEEGEESELSTEQYRRQKSGTPHCDSSKMGDKDQAIIEDSKLENGIDGGGRNEHCDMDENRHHYEEIISHGQVS